MRMCVLIVSRTRKNCYSAQAVKVLNIVVRHVNTVIGQATSLCVKERRNHQGRMRIYIIHYTSTKFIIHDQEITRDERRIEQCVLH